MLPQEETHTPVIFSVLYSPFDGSAQGETLLERVRSEYFAAPRNYSGKVHSVETGLECVTRYKIGRGVFEWRKTGGKALLQRSYRDGAGYCVLAWNTEGELISKVRWDAEHQWLQSCYYAGDPEKPAALLKSGPGGGLFLLLLDAQTQRYTRTELCLCPYFPGSTEQSVINATAGEPEVFVRTADGIFCCCTEEETQWREALHADFRSGVISANPEWPEERDAELHFKYIRNDGSEPEPAPQATFAPQAAKERDYPADHELYSVDGPAPTRYTVAARGLGGETQVSTALAPGWERAAKRIVVSADETYLYFGKLVGGLRQGHGRTQMHSGATAYDGEYEDDKRHGFGVYYYKSGKLCYAGHWKANRRDGSGVAFSPRDGSVFVGRWKNNTPTGAGSAFDAEGNLLYTGEWQNGKRHGHGTEFKDGNIVFSGEFRNDRPYSGYQKLEERTEKTGG